MRASSVISIFCAVATFRSVALGASVADTVTSDSWRLSGDLGGFIFKIVGHLDGAIGDLKGVVNGTVPNVTGVVDKVVDNLIDSRYALVAAFNESWAIPGVPIFLDQLLPLKVIPR